MLANKTIVQIGSHIGNIDDGYLFSGIDIKKEYKKRPNDFERNILSYHIVNSNEEIRLIEKDYLVKYDEVIQAARVEVVS
mgnify:CR=1 FL=1